MKQLSFSAESNNLSQNLSIFKIYPNLAFFLFSQSQQWILANCAITILYHDIDSLKQGSDLKNNQSAKKKQWSCSL